MRGVPLERPDGFHLRQDGARLARRRVPHPDGARRRLPRRRHEPIVRRPSDAPDAPLERRALRRRVQRLAPRGRREEGGKWPNDVPRARVFERFPIPIARDRATTSFPVPSSPSHTLLPPARLPVAACPMVFALGCAPEPERTLSFRPPLASPSVKPSDPSTSSVSSYTATVAGATTRSGWWSSANARQVRWFRSPRLPVEPPRGEQSAPGRPRERLHAHPLGLRVLRPHGVEQPPVRRVQAHRVVGRAVAATASVVASGLHETSDGSLAAPGSRTNRLAASSTSRSRSRTPGLCPPCARGRPGSDRPRRSRGLGSANLGARRWRHEPSTRDHAETRTAKSATIKTSVPAGDQSARAIPAGPSSIVHVQESSETEKHCTTPRACIAAPRTWSGIAAPLKMLDLVAAVGHGHDREGLGVANDQAVVHRGREEEAVGGVRGGGPVRLYVSEKSDERGGGGWG